MKKKFPYNEISFRASGWMVVFYFGVIKYIKENYKVKNIQLTGSSGGALAACALLCNLNLDDVLNELENGNKTTYIFGVCDYVKNKIDRFVVKISSRKLKRNKLNIVCSILEESRFRTHVFSHFNSLYDISNYLKGSIHIPFFGGITPYRYNNYNMYDSIITDSHPHITNTSLKISWTKYCNCGCEKTLNVIRPYIDVPLSWCMSPPKDSLKLLYYHGYYQAKLFFEDIHDDENINIIEKINQKIIDYNLSINKMKLVGLFTITSLIFIKHKIRK